MLVGVLTRVVPESPHRLHRLQSLLGVVVLLGASSILSKRPSKIPWQLVSAGFLAQFYLGYTILRTAIGFRCFKSLGDATASFLSFSDVGAEFVFGTNLEDHFFAFKVLPVTIFFSAFVSVMYFLGVLQVTVRVLAVTFRWLLGTSLVESVNAAGNIFLGQTEAPLLVRPFLATATASEIHCIMTGGFATIAGGVLAAYIIMGVRPEQLIGASVMSAPAALMVSNIFCPPGAHRDELDEEEHKTSSEEGATDAVPVSDDFEFPPPQERNVVEAAANGASVAIGLVANIAAMLIAFLALVQALNALLSFLGSLVGHPTLSFQLICGYAFSPVAWLLGTPAQECFVVGKLISTKVILNEFVAYSELSTLIKAGGLSQRAELVATYALCGFSNFGSVGVQLGSLSALCPERRRLFGQLVLSAMVAGNVACFLTAAVAGILL